MTTIFRVIWHLAVFVILVAGWALWLGSLIFWAAGWLLWRACRVSFRVASKAT